MADDGKRFCERCGANMGPHDSVCPECGSGSEGQNNAQIEINVNVLEKVSRTVALLLGIFALVSLAQGLIYIVANDTMVGMIRTLYTDTQWVDYLSSIGLSSIEQYKDVLFLDGVITVVDGAAAAISFLCYQYRKSFTLSLAFCIYASLFLFSEFILYKTDIADLVFLIMQCLIGLFVARLIYVTRAVFGKVE